MPGVDLQLSHGECAVIAYIVAGVAYSITRDSLVDLREIAEFFRQQFVAAQSNARILMIVGLSIDLVDRSLADSNQLFPQLLLLVAI